MTQSISKERDVFPRSNTIAFVICVAGIYVSYFGFGIVQQMLNESTFGPEKKRFKNTTFLLFLQCVGNYLCSLLSIKISKEKNDETPFTQYAIISATYVGAMFSSNYAIQFVSYPMKELAKSCKPIPVLLMGVLIFGKKQTLLKYVCVLLVTTGIMVYTWDEVMHSNNNMESSLFGIILLVSSLALDGITGPFQDDLIRKYRPNSQNMMLNTNLWASIYLAGILLFTQHGIQGVQFILDYQGVIPYIILFSVSSAIGQNFIYFTINRFGSLVCSMVTTTRKFFSILISSLLFAKPLSSLEWLGVLIVFVGLGVDIYSSSQHKKKE